MTSHSNINESPLNQNNSSSDSDIDNLDEEYENTVKTIKTFKNPEELNFDKHINKDTINEFYEKIKKMPREQVAQLLANLGGLAMENPENVNMGTHDFSEVTETNRQTVLEKLKNKKNQLKMKRRSAYAIKKMKDKYTKKTEDEEKKMAEIPEIEKDTQLDEKKDFLEVSTDTEKSTKTSKSKKRRQHYKAKKLNLQDTKPSQESSQELAKVESS